ncbi:MAG: hypothetical protein V4659_04825 [Pseudomonadota bacterium]
MPIEAAIADTDSGYSRLIRLVAADGSAAQPALARLSVPRIAIADLADAVHCLCLLHGHHNGVMEVTLERAWHPVFREWLSGAHDAFALERDGLARLISAAGPLPSTPGQTESENAVAMQRHALVMLAQSDRAGCAAGACMALANDWAAIRGLLQTMARRLDVTLPATRLPDPKVSRALYEMTSIAPEMERGLMFGAQQFLAQHRGLWGLIDARSSARAAS